MKFDRHGCDVGFDAIPAVGVATGVDAGQYRGDLHAWLTRGRLLVIKERVYGF